MTKDEALRLALEALKQIDEAMPFPVAKLAQKVIKEALAQPEPNYKKALEVWLDKTEWVQETVKPHELGMHRADVLKQRIEEASPQPEHGWTPERIAGMARLKEAQDKKLAQLKPVAWEQFYPEMGKPKLVEVQDGECKYCTDGCPACDARKLPEQDWIERERAVGYREGHRAALAQRTWVGLTDEEVTQIIEMGLGIRDSIETALDKLKEKNESKN